eukprot:TRINITY_DN11519_c0_g1_i1.p1 TRINITY_DN11519_c0_g1~~TRINITY_DN11519_c0_g1_i1.p1  ORF type:complete len:221 (+),score=81.31 TRINITY_DN11519_c0_g1_i1:97-663(+)
MKAAAIATSAFAATAFAANMVMAEPLPVHGAPGTNQERTFIAIKPDGVQRTIVGEIIARFEKKGYKLVGLKLVHSSKEFAEVHYQDLSSKPFFPSLVDYFSSGPIVAMVWEGKGAILGGRRLVGATNPDDSTPGSIRGDLCLDIGRNIIHGSDSAEAAEHEINLWFNDNSPQAEVVSYTSIQEEQLYA